MLIFFLNYTTALHAFMIYNNSTQKLNTKLGTNKKIIVLKFFCKLNVVRMKSNMLSFKLVSRLKVNYLRVNLECVVESLGCIRQLVNTLLIFNQL